MGLWRGADGGADISARPGAGQACVQRGFDPPAGGGGRGGGGPERSRGAGAGAVFEKAALIVFGSVKLKNNVFKPRRSRAVALSLVRLRRKEIRTKVIIKEKLIRSALILPFLVSVFGATLISLFNFSIALLRLIISFCSFVDKFANGKWLIEALLF